MMYGLFTNASLTRLSTLLCSGTQPEWSQGKPNKKPVSAYTRNLNIINNLNRLGRRKPKELASTIQNQSERYFQTRSGLKMSRIKNLND